MLVSVHEGYMRWIMYDILKNDVYDSYRYSNLLKLMHHIPFVPYAELDVNRISDGRELRYRYAHANHIPFDIVEPSLDQSTASVLEVLVALALRIFEETTNGFPIPIKPDTLFWTMIETMHLEDQTDSEFNEYTVQYTIDHMMRHEFAKNGDGSIFRISDETKDMRKAELWYQAQWWVAEAWKAMTTLP